MNLFKKFITDFMGFFVIIVGSSLVSICEVITQVLFALQRFYCNIVIPCIFELAADAYFISLVATQMLLSMLNSVCLSASALLLKIAEHSHPQSERLIRETWLN